MARASGCRASAATRPARPTTTPAWGPPSSLSPEKVTKAAPASIAWRTPGSSRNHAGRRGSHGVVSSRSPEPASLRDERSEEHTSELQSLRHLVCRLLLEKKKKRQPRRSANQHQP